MLRLIILLLIIVPALEIWGLVTVGNLIGAWPTVLLVIATGIAGGTLARREGLSTLRLAQLQLSRGELPGEAMLDGVCILGGGLLLLTPGFFTDIVGIPLLLPYTRGIVKWWVKRQLTRMIGEGRVFWHVRRR